MNDELQAKRLRIENAVRKAHADFAEARIALAGLYSQPGDTIGRVDELADWSAVQRTQQAADESIDRLRLFLEGNSVDEA